MSDTPTPRAKINLTAEKARSILDGDEPGYRIIRDEQCGHRRWSVDHELVIQSVVDNRFWRGYYSVGATESQDESPWEHDEPDFTEVFPVEQVTIAYK